MMNQGVRRIDVDWIAVHRERLLEVIDLIEQMHLNMAVSMLHDWVEAT